MFWKHPMLQMNNQKEILNGENRWSRLVNALFHGHFLDTKYPYPFPVVVIVVEAVVYLRWIDKEEIVINRSALMRYISMIKTW